MTLTDTSKSTVTSKKMVLEDALFKIGRRKIYSFILGVLYVGIAYGTAKLFFPSQISLAMIFFVTLLLVPSTARLITIEEKIERRNGMHRFFRDHYAIIEIFFFLFLGITVGYLLIGQYTPTTIEYQNSYLERQGLVGDFINTEIQKDTQLMGILYNNVGVALIAFVLSIFYGVGALFLIVLNASVFASFILIATETIGLKTLLGGVLLAHTSHEVLGFLLAAMAGGVISKALMKERIGTTPFQNVVKDATILLIISLAVIILAGILEVYVVPLFIA